MIRSLVVPMDGSSFSEHALPLASSLARRANATLHLLHVHQTPPPATVAGVVVMDSLDLHMRQDEQAYLADLSRRVREKGPIEIRSHLVDGEVADGVHKYSSHVGADMVVMCTHGRGAIGRFWLGSVADELIRTLERPVLLVRPHEGNADLNRDMDLANILLPLDGSVLGEQVLAPAVMLGELFHSTFTLVHVVRAVLRRSYLPEGGSLAGLAHSAVEEVYLAQKKAEDEAQRYLDGIAGRLRGQGFTVQPRVVVAEEPAAGILLEAKARRAGLIAMETHGRRGLQRLLLGSVADKIVRGGELPVLLHRPKK